MNSRDTVTMGALKITITLIKGAPYLPIILQVRTLYSKSRLSHCNLSINNDGISLLVNENAALPVRYNEK